MQKLGILSLIRDQRMKKQGNKETVKQLKVVKQGKWPIPAVKRLCSTLINLRVNRFYHR